MPASLRMTSFGAVHPLSSPVSLHADDLRLEDLPREAGHDVDGVRAADTRGEHAEAARVGRVRVRADHHAAREGVLLENDLVDDAAAGLPEADAVLLRGGGHEVEDLLVLLERDGQVLRRAFLGDDEVVAVDRRGDLHLRKAGGHELEKRHLRRRVLHRDAVGAQEEVRAAAAKLLPLRVVEVAEDDLLRVGERAVEPLADLLQPLLHLLVGSLDELRRGLDDGQARPLRALSAHFPRVVFERMHEPRRTEPRGHGG